MINNTRCLTILILVILISAFTTFGFAQSSEEAQGQAAEQAGKLREAVTHYVAALQSASEVSDADQQLREKIIKLVLKLDPRPAIPKEAERFMARGQAAVEIAKGPDDFRNAISEFQKAARLAPWWAAVYYYLGSVQEKAEQYADAIRSFKLYLLASPSATDVKDAESKIFKLEYKQEQAARLSRDAEEQRRREEEQRRTEAEAKARDASWLAGEWCWVQDDGSVDCEPIRRAIVEVAGTDIQINRGHMSSWSGTVEGTAIRGTYYPLANCPSMRFPMTGTISDGGRRLELSYAYPTTYYPNASFYPANKRCTVLATKPVKTTLVRKR